MELYNEDNIQLNELSQRLYLDKSTVSRTVETLVKEDLLNREIPPENRRVTNIKLTQKGLEVCETIHKGNDAYYKEALGAIAQKVLPKFLEDFEILVNKMIELNEGQ